MSQIDFLDNQPGDSGAEPKKTGDQDSRIAWSEPEKERPADKPALKNSPDINKIRQSRREILKLIKNTPSRPDEADEGRPEKKNLFSALSQRFKKQPGKKEILIDYQRVFKREKDRRAPAAPVKPAEISPKKSASKPAKGPGWADRLMKYLKSLRANKVKMNAGSLSRSAGGMERNPAAAAFSAEPAIDKFKDAEKIMPPAGELRTEQEDMPDVLETNLITGEIITFFDWRKKIAGLIAAILIPLFFIAMIYIGIGLYQKVNLAKSQSQVKKLNELVQRVGQEESGLKEINDFRAKLSLITKIFNQHVYWSNFFKFLEDSTIKNVYFLGFSGDTGGVYELSAQAEGYRDIAEQVKLMKNSQYVSKVEAAAGEKTDSGKTESAKVKFNIKLNLLKNIFTD